MLNVCHAYEEKLSRMLKTSVVIRDLYKMEEELNSKCALKPQSFVRFQTIVEGVKSWEERASQGELTLAQMTSLLEEAGARRLNISKTDPVCARLMDWKKRTDQYRASLATFFHGSLGDPKTSFKSFSEKCKKNKHCLCQQPEHSVMYQCEGCEEWFHANCLGISDHKIQIKDLESFYCPPCASKAVSSRGKSKDRVCVCRMRPEDFSAQFLKLDSTMEVCTACNERYHLNSCLGLDSTQMKKTPEFVCPPCQQRSGSITMSSTPCSKCGLPCCAPNTFAKCASCKVSVHRTCLSSNPLFTNDLSDDYLCVTCCEKLDEPSCMYEMNAGFIARRNEFLLKNDFVRPSHSSLLEWMKMVSRDSELPSSCISSELRELEELMAPCRQWMEKVREVQAHETSNRELWSLLDESLTLLIEPDTTSTSIVYGELLARFLLKNPTIQAFDNAFAQDSDHQAFVEYVRQNNDSQTTKSLKESKLWFDKFKKLKRRPQSKEYRELVGASKLPLAMN